MNYYNNLYNEIYGTLPSRYDGYTENELITQIPGNIEMIRELEAFYLSVGRLVKNRYFTLYPPEKIRVKETLCIFAEGNIGTGKSLYGIPIGSTDPNTLLYEYSLDSELRGIFQTGNTLRSFLANFVVIDAVIKFNKEEYVLDFDIEEYKNGIDNTFKQWCAIEITNAAQSAYIHSGKIIQVIWDDEVGGTGSVYTCARDQDTFEVLKGFVSELGLP